MNQAQHPEKLEKLEKPANPGPMVLWKNNKTITRTYTRTQSRTQPETLLPMTCDRWLKTSTQRTQILYRGDVSMILYHLHLGVGDTVLESGTGTLGLTYALSALVGARGKVHTVECNQERYAEAQKEIGLAGLSNTEIYHDTIGGFLQKNTGTRPDRQILQKPVDKVVLDIPEPDEVIEGVVSVLRDLGRVCCFVPCVEQIQRVLKKAATLPVKVERLVENIEIPHKPKCLEEGVYGTTPQRVMRGHTGYLLFLSKTSK
ncbi:tRNA (adenine57-N1/adenine58-N1)-methyltransferase [Nematocida displodere]|uniref:tRNA (adenine(58)-N(1))-methyltransferase catalytic subunit TRM61 n=1 Tax=Nematocida displodere TaxID=1805483 RepID=A0A177EIS3_9MICR|nr:tRNA (adenine57-N1/adenine58-N1)-methyltransferase [Nematocida displodere]